MILIYNVRMMRKKVCRVMSWSLLNIQFISYYIERDYFSLIVKKYSNLDYMSILFSNFYGYRSHIHIIIVMWKIKRQPWPLDALHFDINSYYLLTSFQTYFFTSFLISKVWKHYCRHVGTQEREKVIKS